MRVTACLAASLLLAGCSFFDTEFVDTPRLDEIKSIGTVDPEAAWRPSRLDDFPEANLLVHVELCGMDGGDIHHAALARADAIADVDERQTWLDAYVTAVDVFERQVRYNLASGSISSKSSGCSRADEAYAAWRDTGALPRRLLGG
ncbi:MAG: hypothetical protein ABL308_00585 [Oceanicaulis sp.]